MASMESKAPKKSDALLRHLRETVSELTHQLADAYEEEQVRGEERELKVQEREAVRFDVSEPIVFNVGGVKFATSIDTLRKVPNTYFSNLVSGRWDVKCSKDGSIFIDRNPAAFGFLLEYLRDPEDFHNILKHMTQLERHHLEKDAQFFMLPQQVLDYLIGIPPGFGMSRETFNNLRDLIGFKSQRLLYRCTTDGYGPAIFHQKCDREGPMVVIAEISSGGFVGAYSSVSWNGSSSWVTDASAFLFTVKTGESTIKQFKQVAFPTHALYFNSVAGAAFGNGHDFNLTMHSPLTFNCGGSSTYAAHGIASGTALKEVWVFAVQKPLAAVKK